MGHINKEFISSTPVHAAIVLANILKFSNTVVIYDTHLEGDIAYSDTSFINELSDFLKTPDKSLSIIVRDVGQSGEQRLHNELRTLVGQGGGNIHLYQPTPEFVEAMKEYARDRTGGNYFDCNFAYGDSCSYRLEWFDGGMKYYYAKCNFNDCRVANELSTRVNEFLTGMRSINF